MTSSSDHYHLRLSEPEIGRYRLMAATAVAQEAEAWRRCGIVPGARVADIGCGPGAVLVELARLTGPGGSVVGVDADAGAVDAARRLVAAEGLGNADVRRADAAEPGLGKGEFDVVMIRHVLAHNGPRVPAILEAAVELLRPGGFLWLTDVGWPANFVDPPDDLIVDLLARYRQLHERSGNDLTVGPHLGSWLTRVGLPVVERLAYYTIISPLPPGGGAVRAARESLLGEGLVTEAEFERAMAAFDRHSADPDSAFLVATFSAAGRRPV